MAQIDEWKVETWLQNVHHLAQQMTARLQGTTAQADGDPSKRIGVDQLGKMSGRRGRPSRFAATPNVSSNESRRWINPNIWAFGKLADTWDQFETIHLLTHDYAKAGAADMVRFHDEIIIGAFDPGLTAFTDIVGGALGTADEGEASTVAVPFDTTNQLIVDGGTGMTKQKLIDMNVKFWAKDYDRGLHGPRTIVYAPEGLSQLLADVHLTSAEYASVQSLMTGFPAPGLLGFENWVPYTGLPKVSTLRRYVAYAEEAVVMGLWTTGFSRASEREDLSYTPQIYMQEERGAVRRDDKLVVAMDCVEA